MEDQFDNSIVNDIKKIMQEETLNEAADIISAPTGALALNYVRIDNPDDPTIVTKGAGTLAYSIRRREISRRLKGLAEDLDKGNLSCASLLRVLTDVSGKAGSGNLTAYYLKAFAEAEQVMDSPAGKVKITKAKKNKKTA